MIHLLHGKDSYRVHQALCEIRDGLAPDDDARRDLDSNTSVLDGSSLTPGELMANVTAVPFLAPHRLVIVEGLLAAIGSGKSGRRGKKKPAADDPLAPWEAVAAQLDDAATMPETTTLVFTEPELGKANPAFTMFAPIARTVDFSPLKREDVAKWINDDAKRAKIKLEPRAVAALAELAGSDLWLLRNEVDKLATYAGGETVTESVVRELVASAQDAMFWDLTDAVVAGAERKAVVNLQRLLDDGVATQILLSMLVRQFRQLALVKEMRERRASQDDIARATGVKGWKVNDTASLAARYSWDDLRRAYRLMLDADLNVKRGLQDDESSLQLLVHELCAVAPRSSRASGAR